MKKQPVGLVIEGNSTASTLLRLPGVISNLGPIKSSGLQVARRVSNFLKAGFAARYYTELADARTILIKVPDKSTERLVKEIAEAGLSYSEHVFVLCETWAPTELLRPLQDLGASIASVVMLPTGAAKTFVIEGDLAAIRQMRRLLEHAQARTIELEPDTKHLLFAATILCSILPLPLLVMGQHALRDAGVAGNQLFAVMEEMSQEMLTGFLKSSRVTRSGPLAEPVANQNTYWERLGITHPDLATNLRDLVVRNQHYIGKRLKGALGSSGAQELTR